MKPLLIASSALVCPDLGGRKIKPRSLKMQQQPQLSQW